MKKAVLFVLALAGTLIAGAQSSTPNIGLQIPATGSNNWYIPLNYDFSKIDLMLGGVQPIPALSITNNLTVGGTVTANRFTGVGGGSFPTISGTITANNCAYWVTTTTLGSQACGGSNPFAALVNASNSWTVTQTLPVESGFVSSTSLTESHWSTAVTGTGIPSGTACWVSHKDSGSGSYAEADCVWNGGTGIGGFQKYISPGSHAIGSEVWALVQQVDGNGLATFPNIKDSSIAASTLPICPNGTGGAFTTSGCSGGGGGGLPTATAPGQIVTSTAAGTTYAAQGQLFYQQSGDTIASIETACSSLCTYIVTGPQTITLASNHTLSSNVNVQFMNGGKWTVTGATLTIPTKVTGTLTQHFVSNVLFTTAQGSVNAEWFGAIADWNGTTGTDNLTTMQNALNSLVGTDNSVVLQNGTYMVSSTLVLNKNGLKGIVDNQDEFVGSNIIITSPSATVIQAIGSVGDFTWASMEHVNMMRSVVPTGTATGLYVEYMYGIFRNVQSNDSIRDFYGHGALAVFDTTYAKWGFTGLSMPAGNYYGYWFDSQDGQPMNGLTILESVTNSDPAGTTGTFTGLHIIGSNLQDIYTNHFQTNGGNNAIDLIYTGTNPGTSGLAYDIHFNNVLLDHFSGRGILIQNIPTQATASVEVRNGTIGSVTATGACVDIENSIGVSVTNMASIMCQQSTNDTVHVNASTLINISGDNFPGLGASNVRGIRLTGGTTASVVTNNTIQGTTGAGQAGIFVDGTSTNNIIANNAVKGPLQWGVIVDSSTSGLQGLYSNVYDGTITNPITDSGNNPTTVTTLQAGIAGNAILGKAASGLYNTFTMNGNTADTTRLGFVAGAAGSGDPNWYNDTPAGGDVYWRSGSTAPMHLTAAGYLNLLGGVKPPVYTVSTLPSAATAGAGAIVTVNDSTSFTAGACTGGGSDTMMAVSNGTTWTCH